MSYLSDNYALDDQRALMDGVTQDFDLMRGASESGIADRGREFYPLAADRALHWRHRRALNVTVSVTRSG